MKEKRFCIDCGKELTNHNKESMRCRLCFTKHHSIIMKGKFKGKNNPFYGKHHTNKNKMILSIIKKDLFKDITNHPKFKGFKRKDDRGYILVYLPTHPYGKGNYVYEHRLVMENYLGRYLSKDEVVHHINEIKNDNRIENLQLMSNSEHTTLHLTHEK
jgi:DNA-directed RNA polymerase subunit RPC12/RpoP